MTEALVKKDLAHLAGYAYQRLHNRLRDLTDDEYRWEPAPGCWSVRPGPDGVWTADSDRMPIRPAPLTTIAWRLCHVIDILAGERNATWLGAEPVGTLERTGEPSTAGAAITQLEQAYDLFTRNVDAGRDLFEPMGGIAEPYADSTRFSFVLHEIDELVHHGAEIGTMRDLYTATVRAEAPIAAALARGDRAAVAEQLAAGGHATLLAAQAARRNWDAVRMLVELGVDVDASAGVTALHYAAGTGTADVVDLLLAHGADRTVRDTEFDQPPAVWARYFGHEELAGRLER